MKRSDLARLERLQRLPLPVRDGVSPSVVALPEGDWPTVAAFLIERFPAVPAAEWHARLAAGDVVDSEARAVDARRRYEPGLRVHYYRVVPAERPVPFEDLVLFRDDQLVVADKPHFLPVIPSGPYLQETLLVRLKRRLGIDTLAPLHRIDRGTAGLVLFSVDPLTRGRYHALFQNRTMAKEYEAVVHWPGDGDGDGAAGRVPAVRRSRIADGAHFMQMREVPGEPNSESRIEAIAIGTDADNPTAHLRLRPVSGRRHQLRVHCAALGMPILNDPIYPVLQPETAEDDFTRPLQLLARAIAFDDPLDGRRRAFRSDRVLACAPLAPR